MNVRAPGRVAFHILKKQDDSSFKSRNIEFAVGDTYLDQFESTVVKARKSASVYLNAAFSFRMVWFIVCAERLIDQLMFYQCLQRLRKHATSASG